jgi:hypothetical protein
MQLNNTTLELSRSRPQSSELFLTIFSPTTVLACVPSGTMSAGDMAIPYTGVSTGSYLNVEPDMTMLVGTSVGGMELGKIRVRSASASYINVAENSNIDWANATNLTVLRYWEVWPVYPRIIHDPNNDTDVIFYKDWDVQYSTQNSVLGVFPCAGSHKAGFVGDSFYWSSDGTSHLITGTSLSYSWTFEGGSITGSTSANPGYVQYNTAGDFVTRLIVTGANGSSDKTYRYVSVRNKVGSATTKIPIRKWEMDSLTGGRGEGGYSVSLKIIDEIVPTIRDGDVVMMWMDNFYGGTNTSFGGNSENNSSIFFVGNIVNGSIQYDYKTSTTSFDVSSITDTMKNAEGFAISVESKLAPAKWFELLDMDSRRAIYHYLKYHSTVLKIADFEFRGNDKKIQFFDSDRESIFDSVDNYLRTTLIGSLSADRQNKLWGEVNPWAYPNPTGSFAPIQDILKRDWIGEPNIEVRNSIPLSYLEMGGVAYYGAGGGFSALLSCAPGETPNTRGSVERAQGLALESQLQLNELVGHLYANKTYKYPKIEMDMSGNYTHFDIAPHEAVRMNILAGDTNSNVEIVSPYIIDAISWKYDPKEKVLLPSITAMSLINGRPGDTIIIPNAVDIGGYDFVPADDPTGAGGFNFSFPVAPDLAGIPDNGQPKTVILSSSNFGVLYTLDFDAMHPTWYTMNDGIDPMDVGNIRSIAVTPNGTIFIHTTVLTDSSIYAAKELGGSFVKIANEATFGGTITATNVNPLTDEQIIFIAGPDQNKDVYLATADGYAQMETGSYIKNNYGHIIVVNGNWWLFATVGGAFAPAYLWEYTIGGFSPNGPGADKAEDINTGGLEVGEYSAVSAGGTNIAYMWGIGVAFHGYQRFTAFDTWTRHAAAASGGTDANLPAVTGMQGLSPSPTGKFVMAGDSDNLYAPRKSSDGGATWLTAAGVISAGQSVWENCNDEKRWIFGGGVNMNLTMDWGRSYINKQGTMVTDFPLINITGIRYIN